jgi:hydrogenase 3 maturation protease
MARMARAEHGVWFRTLAEALAALKMPERPTRVAVLGIGNELSADDGAGVLIARALCVRLASCVSWLVLEAGQAPENFGGPLRRFRPDLVLMVDAVQMDAAPGTIAWLDWEQVDGLSASTHTLPPSMFATYLIAEIKCHVALLGIQAARLDFGQPLSAPMQQAVDEVVEGLAHAGCCI